MVLSLETVPVQPLRPVSYVFIKESKGSLPTLPNNPWQTRVLTLLSMYGRNLAAAFEWSFHSRRLRAQSRPILLPLFPWAQLDLMCTQKTGETFCSNKCSSTVRTDFTQRCTKRNTSPAADLWPGTLSVTQQRRGIFSFGGLKSKVCRNGWLLGASASDSHCWCHSRSWSFDLEEVQCHPLMEHWDKRARSPLQSYRFLSWLHRGEPQSNSQPRVPSKDFNSRGLGSYLLLQRDRSFPDWCTRYLQRH